MHTGTIRSLAQRRRRGGEKRVEVRADLRVRCRAGGSILFLLNFVSNDSTDSRQEVEEQYVERNPARQYQQRGITGRAWKHDSSSADDETAARGTFVSRFLFP